MKPTTLAIAVILLAGGWLLSAPACSGSDGRDQDAHAQKDGGHGEATEALWLEAQEIAEFGIEIASAGAGTLLVEVELPGEVKLDPDSLVHITPRVPGVVREVHKGLGHTVNAGDLLAVLESRELAEGKARFLAAGERLELERSKLEREEYLHERDISSEQDYLEAKQAEAEARISLHLAEQRLHALGLSEDAIATLKDQPERDLTRYEMRAPLDGTIVDKHITRGEMLREDSLAFVISDLSRVWIVLTVYQKDLAMIREGLPATIVASHGLGQVSGTIDYVSPILDEHTRTTTARIVVSNAEGKWRPGLFVTGRVLLDRVDASVVVPKTAIQTIEDESVVFVHTDDGFMRRVVRLGRSDANNVEVLGGLDPGDRYVSKNGFVLKAEMNKAAFEHAGHGH